MDNNGQLTFSDDPLLNGVNEVYQLVETGEFSLAVKKLDELMSVDPDYPGLIEAYRTARFWHNREKELNNLDDGKATADFLMNQWKEFEEYSASREMVSSSAHKAAMQYVFFKASEHYKISFRKQENTTGDFELLLNLGDCFLRLEEYNNAIETLEYARNSFKSSARLLAILGEAYFHMNDIPRSLLYFREAFFIDPSEVDLNLVKAQPIKETIEIIRREKSDYKDIREWIPVYAFICDVFYIKGKLYKSQVESIEREIYNLEINYQKLNAEQVEDTNIMPRLINKYLWMLDYYEFQNYNYDHLSQIRDRLITLDRKLFEDYFRNPGKRQKK
ncbi:MAG TPA: hypothetical protein PK926_00620 [Spirochaetota bacterium]|nr:hypothetical protein [Spirochaetota bacterium]HPI87854.1 hypothetical protein [Spirochaetota bacterium]HPR47414.1 hypothetical protein [Spirochaetota bacterium]